MKIVEAFNKVNTNTGVDLIVQNIMPDKKDLDRADNIKSYSAAHKMTALIKDKSKLVRRTKAVYQKFGTDSDISQAFTDRLEEMGFSSGQILAIKQTI